MTRPLIFISYSHKDEVEKDRLLSHLGVLQSAGLISVWSDDEISAGANWQQAISQAVSQARVAILLITANYLTSDFILGNELPALLKRRQEEGLVVFPVIATACAWRMVDWLARMNVRPKNGRPVWSDGGSHVDEDLADIATEVATVIKQERQAGVVVPAVIGQPERSLPEVDDRVLVGPEADAIIQTLDDRDWDNLLYRIKSGKCTPFIGPEVVQAIVPTEADLALAWATEHAYPLNDPHNMPRVAQFLAVRRDPAFPADEVARRLAQLKARPDFDDPDEPHNFLASLPLPLYMTTNYDNFMVQALRGRSRNATQELCRWNKYVQDVPSIFDSDSLMTISNTSPVVYHLFGYAELPESLVLTEDDYLDFLVNISRHQNTIPRQIEKALVSTSLLFIGYQLSDLKFRILFRGLVASMERSLRRTSIAVQLNPAAPEIEGITPAQVRQYVEEYLARDDVRIYWGDSFEFIKELRARWEDFSGRT
jgi:hypothetical protein